MRRESQWLALDPRLVPVWVLGMALLVYFALDFPQGPWAALFWLDAALVASVFLMVSRVSGDDVALRIRWGPFWRRDVPRGSIRSMAITPLGAGVDLPSVATQDRTTRFSGRGGHVVTLSLTDGRRVAFSTRAPERWMAWHEGGTDETPDPPSLA